MERKRVGLPSFTWLLEGGFWMHYWTHPEMTLWCLGKTIWYFDLEYHRVWPNATALHPQCPPNDIIPRWHQYIRVALLHLAVSVPKSPFGGGIIPWQQAGQLQERTLSNQRIPTSSRGLVSLEETMEDFRGRKEETPCFTLPKGGGEGMLRVNSFPQHSVFSLKSYWNLPRPPNLPKLWEGKGADNYGLDNCLSVILPIWQHWAHIGLLIENFAFNNSES